MFVCEECHERDRDATGCLHTAEEHRNEGVISYGPCEICGEPCEHMFCWKYPNRVINLEEKEEMHSEKVRCDYCEHFGKCDVFVREGRDPERAKICMTFIPEKEIKNGKPGKDDRKDGEKDQDK